LLKSQLPAQDCRYYSKYCWFADDGSADCSVNHDLSAVASQDFLLEYGPVNLEGGPQLLEYGSVS
jgi:hypothetical protein